MMEYDSCGNWNIKTCSFVSVLWYVYEEIAQLAMNRYDASSFVT